MRAYIYYICKVSYFNFHVVITRRHGVLEKKIQTKVVRLEEEQVMLKLIFEKIDFVFDNSILICSIIYMRSN